MCGKLTDSGRCGEHRVVARREADAARPTARQRGYGARWEKARKAWLAAHPLCALCERHGRIKGAGIVDHIRPHRGDMGLFWDSTNWQSLCKPCHDIKTAREDGGFGNARR
jgi:5-methylcytosine-specific restriction protein A